MNRHFRGCVAAIGGVVIAASSSFAAYAVDVNDDMGGITAYQIRTDDCLLSSCGYISEDVVNVVQDLALLRDIAPISAGNNALNDGSGSERRARFLRNFDSFVQTVFLDFDAAPAITTVVDFAGNPVFQFPTRPYSQAERDAIQTRLEADYDRFPTIRFTQRRPADDRTFTTLTFACGNGDPAAACIRFDPTSGALSILFGQAQNIDFLNANTGDSAFIDGQFASFVASLGAFGFFNDVLGVPVDGNDPASVATALSTATVNQASNTAAHELGHILGLRHHDSFGAPGDGLPTTGAPSPDAFIPVFDRGQNAAETVDHLMASGASAGISLAASFAEDRFFSERSATKLLATRFVWRQTEAFVDRRFNPDRDIFFTRFLVPNTILEGENSGSRFLDVNGALITEAFVDLSSADVYKFRAHEGEYISAEVVSFSNALVENPVITNLFLLAVNDDGTRDVVAFNQQTFEGFDPFLLDVQIPADGTYELLVQAATFVVVGGGIVIPLEGPNAIFTEGDYELIAYQVDGPLNLRRHRRH